MQGKIIAHFSSVSAIFHTRLASYVRRRLRTWLLAETYALPLDLFRILGGLLCVAYFVSLLLQAQDFSNPDGLLDHVLLQHILWFTRLSLFQPGITLACLYVLLGLPVLGRGASCLAIRSGSGAG